MYKTTVKKGLKSMKNRSIAKKDKVRYKKTSILNKICPYHT